MLLTSWIRTRGTPQEAHCKRHATRGTPQEAHHKRHTTRGTPWFLHCHTRGMPQEAHHKRHTTRGNHKRHTMVFAMSMIHPSKNLWNIVTTYISTIITWHTS